jgi:hypothetical protein
MPTISDRDKAEFVAYLAACTNTQVIGVYRKEAEAKRHEYASLAAQEAHKRGLDNILKTLDRLYDRSK